MYDVTVKSHQLPLHRLVYGGEDKQAERLVTWAFGCVADAGAVTCVKQTVPC